LTQPVIRDLFAAGAPSRVSGVGCARSPAGAARDLGAHHTAKALYAVLCGRRWSGRWWWCGRQQAAEALAECIETFFELLSSGRGIPRPQLLPALDVVPNQRLSPHAEISEQRAIALWRLASERVPITVTPVASALLRTEAAEFYRQLSLRLRVGRRSRSRRCRRT